MMQFSHIVIHFGEVILKGANRRTLEKRLIDDINQKFSIHGIEVDTHHGYGRLILSFPDNANHSKEAVLDILQSIPGVLNIAFALRAETSITDIEEKVDTLITGASFASFKVDTRRSDKTFPLSSQEVNERVGALVQSKTQSRVNLSHPEYVVHIEITERDAFVYTEKYAGMGGLPIGTSGHGLALFSGGIDSPVAAYHILKRGMTLGAIHFHSLPKTSPQSIEKVRMLLHALNSVQPEITLHLVPLLPIQKQIAAHCPESMWIVLQRRFMMRIAERIANQRKAQALITGESLGQVASQTIQNMHAIGSVVTDMPILRPLVGWDKQDIINAARAAGTYETSILPHEDCCTAFTPDSPETKAHLPSVERAEKQLHADALVEDAIAQMETETIKTASIDK